MRLDNPQKFVSSDIDGTLIARGEVICQYSTNQSPSDSDWTVDFDENLQYKWIRISFDGGKTYKIQYKLNAVNEISFSFTITADEFEDSNEMDYTKKYVYEIGNKELYESIKNKPIGVFIEDGNSSMSVLAPIIYKSENDKYYIEILVTEMFINNHLNKICIVKS